MGNQAGVYMSGGSNNSVFGNNTGFNITSGSSNTVLGASVGSTTLTTGSNNIPIGTSSGVDALTSSSSNYLNLGNAIVESLAVPTISSGFGTSPSVVSGKSSAAFTVNVGTGGTATSGVVAFSSASLTGWACDAVNSTSASSLTAVATPTSTTTVTLSSYSRTSGACAAFNASDILVVMCTGY